MRIEISKTIQADHAEIRDLIHAGFRGTNGDRVEVHVKGCPPVVRWRVTTPDAVYGSSYKHVAEQFVASCPGATLERYVRIREAFSGAAYDGIPSIARVGRGINYLVTLKLPTDPSAVDYPKTWKYERYKTAPEVLLYSWQEHLVQLAAHEANHIRQFKNNWPRSEIKCERWALKVLMEWRRGR